MLALPNFNEAFYVECDASSKGVGAVLYQACRSIAFFSKAISDKAAFLSTYKKELLALVLAVKKWCHYLLGRKFIVRTDHQSLRFLLTQKVGTPVQQQWVSKLFGNDFVVEYRSGATNMVADALSRQMEGEAKAISTPVFSWVQDIKQEHTSDPHVQTLLGQLKRGELDAMQYTDKDGILFYKGRFYFSPNSPFRSKVLTLLHNSPWGGHSGYHKTYHRVKSDFYWPGLKATVRAHIRECDMCQRTKVDNMNPAGLLQPLNIPNQIWESISMDFIEGLPLSGGKSTIMVVVD